MAHQEMEVEIPARTSFTGPLSSGSLSQRVAQTVRFITGLARFDDRTIYIGRERNEDFGYCDNAVVTSRYTLLTFFPKFLFESFGKFANTYFLVVSILQTIPSVSLTNGFPLTLVPLSIVLTFEGIITALEDRQRHRDDHQANSSVCRVIENGIQVKKQWKDVKVGDILKIRNRESIPADCLVLASSDEPPQGVCYIETKSLDGETNLKLRQGLIESVQAIDAKAKALVSVPDGSTKGDSSRSKARLSVAGGSKEFAMDQAVSSILGNVTCEKPNPHLDSFNGSAQLQFTRPDGSTQASQKLIVNLNNVILRGCTLRSTDYVYALALNTGHDTKIMQSVVQTKSKLSILDRTINRMLVGFLVVEINLCVLGAVLALDWSNSTSWSKKYISPTFDIGDFFIRGLTFFLLVSSMLPISLYVSLKFIRVCQASFIWWDWEMVDEGQDPLTNEPYTHRAKVRTMDLCDTLGQISYIFSDKTGTLTNNVMEFRKMSIAGKSYGKGTTEIGVAALEREGKMEEAAQAREFVRSVEDSPHPRFFNFVQEGFGENLMNNNISRGKDFFRALALCHEVLIENIKDVDGQDTGRVRLSASSPDDHALVIAAGEMGFKFVGRSNGGRTISVLECNPSTYLLDRSSYESSEERDLQEESRKGVLVHYDLLETLEFSSTRKRASVIVRDPRTGQIRLYCKGADSEVFKRLSTTSDTNIVLAQTTNQHLISFADDGLRTLTVAYRDISESDFSSWHKRYRAALADLHQQEKRKLGRQNKIDSLVDKIENSLELLGATAIEDKLQEAVPQTIKDLANAGIKLWMLTGDRQETAINIAWACQLVDHSMTRIVIHSGSALNMGEMITVLDTLLRELDTQPDRSFALVIDGGALKIILGDEQADILIREDCETLFVNLATRCKAVICCRVSPKQKAQVVELVQIYRPNERTLAVGDGANDVGMIQNAHVGVGISGLEGMQAVNSADFAIGRFKFLKRLLLLHGRTNYRRASKLVILILYKSVLMNLPQIIWSHANGYSGQNFYFLIAVEGYNILFTNTIIVASIYDKDLPDRYVLQFPSLYELGREYQLLNVKVFWGYMLNAGFQAILAYLALYFCFMVPFRQDLWTMGSMLFTAICCVANVKVALEVYAWNRTMMVMFVIIFFSWPLLGLLFEQHFLISFTFGWQFQNIFTTVVQLDDSWYVMMIVFVTLLIRDVTWKALKRECFPELRHILQEHAKLSGKPFNYMGPVEGIEGYHVVTDAPFTFTTTTSTQIKEFNEKAQVIVADEAI